MHKSRYPQLFISGWILAALFIPSVANAVNLNTVQKEQASWLFVPGVNLGYNKLLKGYTGYKDLGNVGLDLYIRGPRENNMATEWKDNLMTRISLDYFPLQVPKGLYGVTEDIYSLNAGYIYQFQRLSQEEQWIVPFAGVGIGMYRDVVTLDTPASGKITGTNNYLGFNGSIGLLTPIIPMKHFRSLRFIPEIRYHYMRIPDGKATNVTFQLGLSFWPSMRVEE